jgi:hypothetical protein
MLLLGIHFFTLHLFSTNGILNRTRQIFIPCSWLQFYRHRHLPRPVYTAARERRGKIEKAAEREENRRAHSAPGSIPRVPLRKRKIIKEVE